VRVLVLSDHATDEGRRDRLRAVAGLGVDLIVATPGGTAGSDGAIRLAPVPVKGNPADPRELRWQAGTIRRLLTETRPTLVHLEAEPESPLAATTAAVCRKLGVPFVLFSWRSRPTALGFFARRRARRVLGQAAGVLGGNRVAMDLLHEHAPQALAAAIPPRGLSLPPSVSRPEREQLVVGYAGRLTPERGPDLLIAALGKTYGRWQAVIAGTGPEQESLEREIQRLGLASRIRWLGGIRTETLETLWQEIDCLVVPSRDTADWVDHQAPLLLEAMGRGIPAVVTRAGALPELVGDAGVVVDGAEDLATALQGWVTDPARCRAAGAMARQWTLERYVTSVVAGRTLAFWQATAEHLDPSLAHAPQE